MYNLKKKKKKGCAMPTQFNTKDSGRHTEESLTAMTTHASRNDTFIFCYGCIVSRGTKPTLDDTAVSVSASGKGGKTGAHTGSSSSKQTKPHDKRLRLSRAASFFAPLQQEAAAAAAATHWIPTNWEFKKDKGPRSYLRASVEGLTSPVASLDLSPRWLLSVMVGTVMCLPAPCY